MSRSAPHTSSAFSSVAPPRNTASRAKSCLLVLVEKVVAPRDRGAQRGVALVGVPTALEEIEPLRDPLEQLLRAEQLHAGGGELDREREAVETLDQLVDGGRVADVGADRLRALEEQRHGVGLDHRRQVELDLAGNPQRLAARREDPERGRGGEQLGDRPGGVRQQLLEIVEDDVRLLVAEAGCDGTGAVAGRAEVGCDQRHHERRHPAPGRAARRRCRRQPHRPGIAPARSRTASCRFLQGRRS